MADFEAAGASLVAISPQLPEKNEEMRAQHKLGFPILSDRGNEWARRLSLTHTFPADLRELYLSLGLDVPAHNGDDSWELPIPARLIVDTAGTLRHIDAHPDYKRRPEPETTLEALRQMG